MKYLLPCPACQNEIPVETGQAGQLLQCVCGQQLEVPTVRRLQELKTVEEKVAPAARWNRRKGFRFLGGAIAAIGLALAAYIGLSWPSINDSAAIAKELRSQPPYVAFLRLQSLEPPMPTPANERVESAPQLAPSKKLLMQVEGAGPQNLAPQQAYVAFEHLRARHTLLQILPFAGIFVATGVVIVAFSFLVDGQRQPRRRAPRQGQQLV